MFVSKFLSFGIKSGTIGKVVSLFFCCVVCWEELRRKSKNLGPVMGLDAFRDVPASV